MKMSKRLIKPLLSLGTLALVSQANLLPAHADTVGPTFSYTNPLPGNYVYSLQNAELSCVFGNLDDVDGVSRVDVFIRRYSDGAYWNGGNWQYPSAVVPSYLTQYTITSYGFQAPNGPPSAAIIAGQHYLVVVKAADKQGNVSTYSATITGVDS